MLTNSSQGKKSNPSYIWIPFAGSLIGAFIGWLSPVWMKNILDLPKDFGAAILILYFLFVFISIFAILGIFAGLQIRWYLLNKHLAKDSRSVGSYWILFLGGLIGTSAGIFYRDIGFGFAIGLLLALLVRKYLNRNNRATA